MPYDLEKFRAENLAYANEPLRRVATDLFNIHRSSFQKLGINSVEAWGEKEGLTKAWDDDEQNIIAQKRQKEIDQIRRDNLEGMNFFTRSVARGVDQLQAMSYGAVGLIGSATGIDPLKKAGLEGYQRNIEEASLYPGTEFKEIGEAKGLGKVAKGAKWAFEKLGENLPILATTLATGGVGGIAAGGGRVVGSKVIQKALGSGLKNQVKREAAKALLKESGEAITKKAILKKANELSLKNVSSRILLDSQKSVLQSLGGKAGLVAGMGAIESGGMFGDVAEKGFDDRAAAVKSLAFGMTAGLVELAGGLAPRMLNRMFGKQKAGVVSQALDRVAKSLKRGEAEPETMHLLSRMWREAADNVPQEFAQESAQEILGLMNIASNDPTFEVFSEQNIGQIFEAGVAGAAVGGLMGGASGVLQSSRAAAERYKASSGLEDDVNKSLIDAASAAAELGVEPDLAADKPSENIPPDVSTQGAGEVAPPPASEVAEEGSTVKTEEKKKNLAPAPEAQFGQKKIEPKAKTKKIQHYTSPENVKKILADGYDTKLPPIHGTGAKEGGKKTGKAGEDILYFTTDKGRWSTAEVFVGEGKGDISRPAYDYDKQKWIEEKNAYKKVSLKSVEAEIKKGAKTLNIHSLKDATEYLGKLPDKHEAIRELTEKAKKDGFDIVNIKHSGGKSWHREDGMTDRYDSPDWYNAYTGNSGKDDFFILNKDAVDFIKPEAAFPDISNIDIKGINVKLADTDMPAEKAIPVVNREAEGYRALADCLGIKA